MGGVEEPPVPSISANLRAVACCSPWREGGTRRICSEGGGFILSESNLLLLGSGPFQQHARPSRKHFYGYVCSSPV